MSYEDFESEMPRFSPDGMSAEGYEAIMEEARALSDATRTAGGSGMDFDAAFRVVKTMHDSYDRLPLMPLLPDDECSASMEPEQFFYVAEAIDTILTFGTDAGKLKAAIFANELNDALMYASGSEVAAKRTIFKGVLGITPGTTPVSQQLAERYLVSDTTPDSYQAVVDQIKSASRTAIRP